MIFNDIATKMKLDTMQDKKILSKNIDKGPQWEGVGKYANFTENFHASSFAPSAAAPRRPGPYGRK